MDSIIFGSFKLFSVKQLISMTSEFENMLAVNFAIKNQAIMEHLSNMFNSMGDYTQSISRKLFDV